MNNSSSHWPVRRLRNNDSLVVSDDRTVVSRVSWDADNHVYFTERLSLDVDPTDGMTLVERNPEGVIVRLASAEADEWLLTAEWDPESREDFGSYSSAIDLAQRRTDP